MPSSEDCMAARSEVYNQAVLQLIKEGHQRKSAEMIAQRMSYDEKVQYAEKYRGKKIYRGPYSPY
jgi:hypothetical protein